MAGANTKYHNHTTIEETATEEEQSRIFSVDLIFYISNDGEEDIVFNLDRATTEGGAFTVKPGETMAALPRVMDTLHFRAVSGTSDFRVFGARE